MSRKFDFGHKPGSRARQQPDVATKPAWLNDRGRWAGCMFTSLSLGHMLRACMPETSQSTLCAGNKNHIVGMQTQQLQWAISRACLHGEGTATECSTLGCGTVLTPLLLLHLSLHINIAHLADLSPSHGINNCWSQQAIYAVELKTCWTPWCPAHGRLCVPPGRPLGQIPGLLAHACTPLSPAPADWTASNVPICCLGGQQQRHRVASRMPQRSLPAKAPRSATNAPTHNI